MRGFPKEPHTLDASELVSRILVALHEFLWTHSLPVREHLATVQDWLRTSTGSTRPPEDIEWKLQELLGRACSLYQARGMWDKLWSAFDPNSLLVSVERFSTDYEMFVNGATKIVQAVNERGISIATAPGVQLQLELLDFISRHLRPVLEVCPSLLDAAQRLPAEVEKNTLKSETVEAWFVARVLLKNAQKIIRALGSGAEQIADAAKIQMLQREYGLYLRRNWPAVSKLVEVAPGTKGSTVRQSRAAASSSKQLSSRCGRS